MTKLDSFEIIKHFNLKKKTNKIIFNKKNLLQTGNQKIKNLQYYTK